MQERKFFSHFYQVIFHSIYEFSCAFVSAMWDPGSTKEGSRLGRMKLLHVIVRYNFWIIYNTAGIPPYFLIPLRPTEAITWENFLLEKACIIQAYYETTLGTAVFENIVIRNGKKYSYNKFSYNYVLSPTQADHNSRRLQYSHVFFILFSCFSCWKFEKTLVTCKAYIFILSYRLVFSRVFYLRGNLGNVKEKPTRKTTKQNFAWRPFFEVNGISIIFSRETDVKTGESIWIGLIT